MPLPPIAEQHNKMTLTASRASILGNPGSWHWFAQHSQQNWQFDCLQGPLLNDSPIRGQFPANRAKSVPGECAQPRVPIAPNYGRMKGTPPIGKRSGESATNRTSQWSEWLDAQLCADEPSDWRRAQSIFGVVFGGGKAVRILGPAIGEMDGHVVGRNMMRKLGVLGF